ncbi:MAG: GYDIA family GHMP kinase [Bacteroidota bacterium]
MLNKTFYSNGKLLFTAEYLVLDGAKALALPTIFGQDLVVKNIDINNLIWESFDEKNKLWFSCSIDLPNQTLLSSTENNIANALLRILNETQKLNPEFLKSSKGFHIKTKLSFPRNWGLGTSSTLINNIAQWAKVDPFKLQFKTFGGSAYDIACAKNNSPILYQLQDQKPIIEKVNFNPNFSDQLYFVYLNKKQNSREGIAKYREFTGNIFAIAEEISQITNAIINSKFISDFEKLIVEHEKIIATVIQQKPIQEKLFSDYFGQTKSLGAWGGDFILATGNEDTPNYFKEKGFETVITYQDMIL